MKLSKKLIPGNTKTKPGNGEEIFNIIISILVVAILLSCGTLFLFAASHLSKEDRDLIIILQMLNQQ